MDIKNNKLKTLTHWLCDAAPYSKRLDRASLGKMLWYADVMAYAWLGHSITGASYKRQTNGPEPSGLQGVLNALVCEGRIVIDTSAQSKRDHEEIVARRPANGSEILDRTEMAIVGEVTKTMDNDRLPFVMQALPHDTAWRLASIGEPIPYEAVWASQLGALDGNDIAWCESQLERMAL